MAAMEKYDYGQSCGVLRHDAREILNSSNPDIDPGKSVENEQMIQRQVTPREYLDQRLSELYRINRKDIRTMCEWVVTLPRDTPRDQEKFFFRETFEFLNHRYGGRNGENCVSAVIHRDESGQPHLHFDFIPVARPTERSGGLERLCANDVLTRSDLRSFHGDLQRHLDAAGVSGTVVDRSVLSTGKTLRQQYADRGERRPHAWQPREKKLEQVRERTREIERERMFGPEMGAALRSFGARYRQSMIDRDSIERGRGR